MVNFFLFQITIQYDPTLEGVSRIDELLREIDTDATALLIVSPPEQATVRTPVPTNITMNCRPCTVETSGKVQVAVPERLNTVMLSEETSVYEAVFEDILPLKFPAATSPPEESKVTRLAEDAMVSTVRVNAPIFTF